MCSVESKVYPCIVHDADSGRPTPQISVTWKRLPNSLIMLKNEIESHRLELYIVCHFTRLLNLSMPNLLKVVCMYMFVYMPVCMGFLMWYSVVALCHSTHVEVREQLCEVSSVLPFFFGFLGSNSGCQACIIGWQSPLSIELFHCAKPQFYLEKVRVK